MRVIFGVSKKNENKQHIGNNKAKKAKIKQEKSRVSSAKSGREERENELVMVQYI